MRRLFTISALATCLVVPQAVASGQPEHVAHSYAFAVRGTLETTGDATTTDTVQWSGSLGRTLARVFRDGSRGWAISVGDVAALRNGQAIESALPGKAFELRNFSTGEVLRLGSFRPLAGSGRDGEVLAPLWWALSPLPPAIKKGESATRRSVLPLLIDESRGIRFQATQEWTHHGKTRLDGHGRSRLIHLSYRGPLQVTGREAAFLGKVQVSGEVTGQVWLKPRTLEVVRHELDWSLVYEAPPDTSRWKRHTQRLSVTLESTGAQPQGPATTLFSGPDAAPLPLYLDAERLRPAIHAGSHRWAGCFAEGAGVAAPVPVRITVLGSGEIASVTAVDPTSDPDTIACLRRAADRWTLLAHHESSTGFRYVVVSRAGSIQPYPIVEMIPRSTGTLFLRVPPDRESLVE